MTPGHPGDHETRPQQGTCTRLKDGRPADLLDPADYPMTATCAGCGRAIEALTFYSSEWRHQPPGNPARHGEGDATAGKQELTLTVTAAVYHRLAAGIDPQDIPAPHARAVAVAQTVLDFLYNADEDTRDNVLELIGIL